MSKPYCYEYPRPSVTVDLVVFGLQDGQTRVLLIRRGQEPFTGRWALPGGFLDMDEEPEVSARRELKEETGLELPGPVQPLGFFGAPGRDPRGRTISLVYWGTIEPPLPEVEGSDDASEAAWMPTDRPVGGYAFDHEQIIKAALKRFRRLKKR
ncbi:hypothetical protein BH23PLA1_BH23PLA1_14510 [soil metagenome]